MSHETTKQDFDTVALRENISSLVRSITPSWGIISPRKRSLSAPHPQEVELEDLSASSEDSPNLLRPHSPRKRVRIAPLVPVSVAQKKWDELAKFLLSSKLKNLSAAQFPIRLDLPSPIRLPIFEASVNVEYVVIEKRFSSRKLPHLVKIVSDKGEERRYVFKENDNMAMDAAIMALLVRSNQIWRLRQCPAWTRTYDVVATYNNSGFCQLLPGFTMLAVSNEEIISLLGYSASHWEHFYQSLVGAMVVTAAFDITDRHENNMLFVPDGDVALIDLSCSLGNRNPLDVMMHINPVYFPLRLRKVFETYQALTKEREISPKLGGKTYSQLEEDAMMSYYALFNDAELSALLRQAEYRMPTPIAFLKSYHNRRITTKERCEKMRNGICRSMEDSDRVTKVITTLSKTLPG